MNSIAGKAGRLDERRRALGFLGAVLYSLALKSPRLAPVLRVKGVKGALRWRAGDSDLAVFYSTFVQLEYQPLRELQDVNLIVDAGANAGFTALQFLTWFPDAEVVAIEPDPDNAELARHNLRYYADRCRVVEAAVWTDNDGVNIQSGFRGDLSWSRSVASQPGQGERVPSVTLDSIAAGRRMSILKLDIEGAETAILQPSSRQWLDAVDTLAIELHPDSPFGDPTIPFEAAVEDTFDLTSCGENVFATRRRAN